jgi:S-DNA-T family DNA segregation ATPase FtsK/SpoIIIE
MSKAENKPIKEELPEIFPDTVIFTKNNLKKYFGIFCLFIAIYLSIALFSYFFTWKVDQDKVLDFSWNSIFNKDVAIANSMGSLGALATHILVFELFGIATIFVITFLFALGFNITLNEKIFKINRIFIFSILWIFYMCTLATFIFPKNAFPFGGGLGILCYEWTIALIGKIGLGILLFVAGLSFFGLNLKIILSKIKEKFKDWNTKRKLIIEQEILKQKDKPIENKIIPTQEEAGYELESIIPEEKIAPLPHTKDDNFEILNPNIIEENNIESEVETDIPIEETTETNEVEIIQENEIVELEIPVVGQIANKEIKDFKLDLEIEEVQPFGLIEHVVNTEEEKVINPIENFEDDIVDEEIDANINYDPKLDLSNYKYPGTDLLEEHGSGQIEINKEELERNKNQIVETLSHYNIGIDKIKATIGPTVTLYEIVPEKGVRISKIKNLEDDIALSLSALGIRIIAPIPGRGTIGIEVPNVKKSIVSMKSLLEGEKFRKSDMDLPIALGKSISNEDFIIDLTKMPHMLMAGATGQGKSVGINAILISLLYKKHPAELKLVMVDPKKVELSLYKLIEKHYLAKLPNEEEAIITDTKKVIYTLNALCIEMDERYELLKTAGVRHIKEYNQKFTNRRLNPNKGHRFLPYIVLVVDEFADLMMTAGKEVEAPIARLAQLARAIGIHLVIATQRPSVNIITGTIKANFPGRIAFKVTAKVDSRTILDAGGADQLIGRGDMLLSQGGDIVRLQCPFVDTPEVERIAKYIGDQMGYATAYDLPEYVDPKEAGNEKTFDYSNKDDLFEEAARLIVRNQIGSTSLIQRKLALGYARSGRLMDQLEAFGIVGPNLGSKAREVYIKTEDELERMLNM